MSHARRSLLAAALAVFTSAATAAEGMWTLDALPSDALRTAHDFTADEAFVQRAMRAAVRLAGGCSGSFVSPGGLVLTNHHCAESCIADLSTRERDLIADGFVAKRHEDERQCPGMEVNQLERMSDVTAEVQRATAGKSGDAYNEAKRAAQSKLQSACVGDDAATVRCDVVELYQGGIQHLYRYRRYQDVRLAFAPESAAASFGGDPDNFNFPRYALDMTLLRVYSDGKPIESPAHFPIAREGAEPGELVMTLGHPGTTQRLLTVAQLETQRDLVLPFRIVYSAEYRGLLRQYSTQSPEHARTVAPVLNGVENGIKARSGMQRALVERERMDEKRRIEAEFRRWIESDAKRREAYGDPWAAIEGAQRTYRNLYLEYVMVETGLGFLADTVSNARTLVRAAYEREKPDAERLREYTDAALPAIRANVLAERPHYPERDRATLAWSLAKLREVLGADHPFVREALGRSSPELIAKEIIEGTKLDDAAVREKLWNGGRAAIDASRDPAIVLARTIEQRARPLRERYEDEVESVEKRAAESLARARFAWKGTSVYPDATFSLRLSYGEIRGWDERGTAVEPYTTVDGLYARATGHAPFDLAPRWEAARERIEGSTRYNQVSTNDVVGGNSGSPLIDADGRLVGLVFDGNIHSLGGSFFYDESLNRTISVHPAVMLEALRTVYGAGALAEELAAGARR
jgi:hypothetical protein